MQCAYTERTWHTTWKGLGAWVGPCAARLSQLVVQVHFFLQCPLELLSTHLILL